MAESLDECIDAACSSCVSPSCSYDGLAFSYVEICNTTNRTLELPTQFSVFGDVGCSNASFSSARSFAPGGKWIRLKKKKKNWLFFKTIFFFLFKECVSASLLTQASWPNGSPYPARAYGMVVCDALGTYLEFHSTSDCNDTVPFCASQGALERGPPSGNCTNLGAPRGVTVGVRGSGTVGVGSVRRQCPQPAVPRDVSPSCRFAPLPTRLERFFQAFDCFGPSEVAVARYGGLSELSCVPEPCAPDANRPGLFRRVECVPPSPLTISEGFGGVSSAYSCSKPVEAGVYLKPSVCIFNSAVNQSAMLDPDCSSGGSRVHKFNGSNCDTANEFGVDFNALYCMSSQTGVCPLTFASPRFTAVFFNSSTCSDNVLANFSNIALYSGCMSHPGFFEFRPQNDYPTGVQVTNVCGADGLQSTWNFGECNAIGNGLYVLVSRTLFSEDFFFSLSRSVDSLF